MQSQRIQYISSDFSLDIGKELSELRNPELAEAESTDQLVEEEPIKWIRIIFLPFQKWWQWIVLFFVFIKCFFGPWNALSSKILCDPNFFAQYPVLEKLRFCYTYISNPVYVIDTFFYIIHRQVADEASKREFLPKSGYLIIFDILTLIPFYDLVTDDLCNPIQLWPHILHFQEIFIIYRIASFFKLSTTHSYMEMFVGYSLMFIIVCNSLICFFIMWTFHGLCEHCTQGIYDWRSKLITLLGQNKHSVYVYYSLGFNFICNHLLRDFMYTRPITHLELILSVCLTLFGYFIQIFVLMPKLFGEDILRIKSVFVFHPRAKRIIEETERRNPSPLAHVSVENFYALLWRKRSGITTMPKVINDLPLYMQAEIKQDLAWAVFYHSPTLRKTTSVYKRWLCRCITIKYKQPGERFFTGPHCYSNLYYLKSGIIQLISCEDSASPLLSITSGTLFGDVSFLIPPRNRKIMARCLTYCEVIVITRADILMSLHKFPEDRRNILKSVQGRLQHAHELFMLKDSLRGEDRTEDEGIAWIKRRWWEIHDAINTWKKSSRKKKCELPTEEQTYHCAKFIGQLVLCKETDLQRKSMFINVTFPWIVDPYSTLINVWNRIIFITVFLVLFIHPPYILKQVTAKTEWFEYFSIFVDILYIADVVVSLFTAVEANGSIENNLGSIISHRLKNKFFILDLLSTSAFEIVLNALVFSTNNEICHFNRLIKVYLLFFKRNDVYYNRNHDPVKRMYYKVVLASFAFVYVPSFAFFMALQFTTKNQNGARALYGNICLNASDISRCHEFVAYLGIQQVFVAWLKYLLFYGPGEESLSHVYLNNITQLLYEIFLLCLQVKFISYIYMKLSEKVKYQYFVTNLKHHYKRYKIHPDLLKRLDRYLNCHWKYYNGMDILHPQLIKDEPYDIYYKLHGEVAEKIIGESEAFIGADMSLIRQLARHAKYLILPKNTTLIMFGVQIENVTWIVQGVAKSEYHDEKGETLKLDVPRGKMLSMSSVFLNRASLRTYTAATDVEILYIKLQDFFKIISRFEAESAYFKKCKDEIGPVFDELFVTYLKKHRDYQKKLREKIFHARQSVSGLVANENKLKTNILSRFKVPSYFKNYRTDPESKIILHWLTLRAVIVVLVFTIAMIQGVCPVPVQISLNALDDVLHVFIAIDMVIKMFLPYYDHRGLIITNVWKCAVNYITRGFATDVIGLIFGNRLAAGAKIFIKTNAYLSFRLRLAKYCQLYLLTGYFNYVADKPSAKSILILILKWQIILLLNTAFATYFLNKFCIDYILIDGVFEKYYSKSKCWMPKYFKLNFLAKNKSTYFLSTHEITLIYVHAVAFTLDAYKRTPQSVFNYSADLLVVVAHHLFCATVFWFLYNLCLTLLILYNQGHTQFRHGVNQLKSFLKEERVPDAIINKSTEHFMYWWKRTAGINMKILINDRIGVVFRQDLNYYYFKKTFRVVDTLLRGGESLERMLASSVSELYYLPGQDIMRELDLTPSVFIVHRGKVSITRNGEKLAVLTKGSIFGQLVGSAIRPVIVTARSIDHVDILTISVKKFQEAITDDVKFNISRNPQSKFDFMAIKKTVSENPYNSIEYILRGSKTIKLPRMNAHIQADSNKWYARWLLVVWALGPLLSSALSLHVITLPRLQMGGVAWTLIVLDIIHLTHVCTDFYSMQLVVEDIKCVYKYKRLKKFTSVWIYLDIISLVVPVVTIYDEKYLNFQVARLLRLYAIYFFDKHFCRNFQATYMPILLKFVCMLLLLHALACGFILLHCKSMKGNSLLRSTNISKIFLNSTDGSEWTYNNLQRKDACPARSLFSSTVTMYSTTYAGDYSIAIHWVVSLLVNSDTTLVKPLNVRQTIYRIFVGFLFYLLEMWYISIIISFIYTKFREMYYFDFNVYTLLKFLRQNGVSSFLRDSIKTYTQLLWQRQKGNWLPDITLEAPLCLREDILSSLYMHHLSTPVLFQCLPEYFLRQLVVRLKRVVIFPGKCIVLEGAVNTRMYFIHEGEVEKWYTDRNGDARMSGVLTINGYFGLYSGLFPNTPYIFSYFTRSVTDLVYLALEDWQDLLNGYPDLKFELYTAAMQMRKDAVKEKSQSKMSVGKGSHTNM